MIGHKTIIKSENLGSWRLNQNFLIYKLKSVTSIFHCSAVHVYESILKIILLCFKILKPFHPNYTFFISLDSFQDVRKRTGYHLLMNTFDTYEIF